MISLSSIAATAVQHVIDARSPLYGMSRDDLATATFEIVVILEGIVPSNGCTVQARSSYGPDDIMWGQRYGAIGDASRVGSDGGCAQIREARHVPGE